MNSTEDVAQTALRETVVPAVSIIMPAYRVTEYIGAALDSVLAQTFTDYEIVVVNDGSPDTDELESVLEPYRERIVYIKQENRGVSGARNTAVRAARGALIAQLDPDDLWEPDYLAVQVAAMQNDPTIDVLYPNAVIFGDALDAGQEYMTVCPSEGDATFERIIAQQCNVLYSVTARREAIIRAGMFDEALRCSEDFDLWLRIAKQGGRIAYHRRVLVRYRRRPGSHTSDAVWISENILRVLDKTERTLDLSPAERETLERARARYRATLRLHEGRRAFFRGDTNEAINGLTEANTFFKNRKIALTLMLLRRAPRLLMRVYDIRDRFILRTSTKS